MTVRIQVSSSDTDGAVEVFRSALEGFPPGVAIDLSLDVIGQPGEPEPLTDPGKWEYAVMALGGSIVDALNQLGALRWELAGVIGEKPEGLMIIVRRPKRLIEIVQPGVRLS